MAKRRAKKATRARTVKRSKSRRRPRRPAATIEVQPLLFDPKTGEPTRPAGKSLYAPRRKPTARELAAAKQRAAEGAEIRARRRARLAMRRQAGEMPKELEKWLLSLEAPHEHDAVMEVFGWESRPKNRQLLEALVDWARKWYLRGCRQGYIEGRVVELVARRRVSDKRHRRRREQVVQVDGRELDMDARDAAIFAELPALKREHGAEEAERLLAKKHEMSDRRIRQIYLEQAVLREQAALVRQGLGDAEASQRVVDKFGRDKHGKPDEKRQAAVRDILAKGRLRSLPELP